MGRVIFVCDGCGKQGDGFFVPHDIAAHKPPHWFAQRAGDGVRIACSRPCRQDVAKASGKTAVVLPF